MNADKTILLIGCVSGRIFKLHLNSNNESIPSEEPKELAFDKKISKSCISFIKFMGSGSDSSFLIKTENNKISRLNLVSLEVITSYILIS
jgi:hypothetical protein